MVDWLQLALAAAVLWSPGLAWTWALLGDLDAPSFLAVSVVVALTLLGATLYVGSVFLQVPLRPSVYVFTALALASLGLARALAPRLDRLAP